MGTTTRTCCDIGDVEDTLNQKVIPLLERLDERTEQHEKRMDRADSRTAGISALLSAVVAGLVGFIHPSS